MEVVTYSEPPTPCIRLKGFKLLTDSCMIYFFEALTIWISRFAFGPMDPCGSTMAAKIIAKPQRSTYSTFMFSGTIFGRFTVHIFSGLTISCISVESSYFILSALGIIWIIIWVIMMQIIPYELVSDASDHSLGLSTTPWAVIFKSMPFISLLIATLG